VAGAGRRRTFAARRVSVTQAAYPRGRSAFLSGSYRGMLKAEERTPAEPLCTLTRPRTPLLRSS